MNQAVLLLMGMHIVEYECMMQCDTTLMHDEGLLIHRQQRTRLHKKTTAPYDDDGG